VVEEAQRLIRVLGGACAQVRPLAARIDRYAEIIQVRQVPRLFIGERPFLYTGRCRFGTLAEWVGRGGPKRHQLKPQARTSAGLA